MNNSEKKNEMVRVPNQKRHFRKKKKKTGQTAIKTTHLSRTKLHYALDKGHFTLRIFFYFSFLYPDPLEPYMVVVPLLFFIFYFYIFVKSS